MFIIQKKLSIMSLCEHTNESPPTDVEQDISEYDFRSSHIDVVIHTNQDSIITIEKDVIGHPTNSNYVYALGVFMVVVSCLMIVQSLIGIIIAQYAITSRIWGICFMTIPMLMTLYYIILWGVSMYAPSTYAALSYTTIPRDKLRYVVVVSIMLCYVYIVCLIRYPMRMSFNVYTILLTVIYSYHITVITLLSNTK